jgi:hypothetical protein
LALARDALDRAKQTVVEALVPLLRGYLELDLAGGMPEAFSAQVVTATGLKGGNQSHGGKLAIRFEYDRRDCGDNEIHCTAGATEDCGAVDLVARGDWEQAGLICALISLLADILPIYSEPHSILVLSCIECGEFVDRRLGEGRRQWSCPRCGKINDVASADR